MQQLMQNKERLTEAVQEAGRALTICNACRYCEGHCAVFQAMELRTEFNASNLDYLANLCHNCSSCYHNCQYAAPHEFNVNIPATMAELRQESYGVHAWPAFMGRFFTNNGFWLVLLAIVVITLFTGFTVRMPVAGHFPARPENSFYDVMSHESMVILFGGVSVFVLIALTAGMARFWRVVRLPGPLSIHADRIVRALFDMLTLKNLDGGNGQGCSYPAERPSLARRRFHHLTFYGFLLCFAATTVGAFYHYVLGWPAPYGHGSLPKILGSLGGLGLLLGPAGLLWLKSGAEDATKGATNNGMDVSFLVLLFLTSLTGLVLMVLRNTPWVAVSLSVHLGVVLTLFLAMPYGKFIHGFYRFIALIAFAVEKHDQKPLV